MVDDTHELGVAAAEFNDFRVRCNNIALLACAELAHRQVNGLLFCDCVKLHA